MSAGGEAARPAPPSGPMALFAPPQVIETQVFARIPDTYRRPDRRSPWGDVQRPGRSTDCFIEGPAFDRDGNLYVVDIPWGRIFRIDAAGRVELFVEYDGEPNGLAIHPDGTLHVADHRRGILTVDPRSRAVATRIERDTMDHFKGVNDLVFAANGDLWFTDQGGTGWHDPTGRLYRLRADGRLDRVLDRVPSPNGLVLDRDERTVYLAVTRANAIWRVPLLDDGSAFKVGTFVQLSGGSGPDGMAMDEADHIAVAHFGLGCAWLISPQGVPVACVRSCQGAGITNVAFGGPQRRTLYLTDSETGCVLTAPMPAPGRVLASGA